MSYLALEALEVMQHNQVCVAAASDGRDNSDFAGAIADEETRKALGLKEVKLDDYKVCRDSNPPFRFADDLINTGIIEANVSDLVLVLTPHE
jgi:glycerate-2-kinase